MKIKIITPHESETERLEQLLNYYHSRLQRQLKSILINLTHVQQRDGQTRYQLEIIAELYGADRIELQEVQPDLLVATKRVLNRILSITGGQHYHLPSMRTNWSLSR